MPTLYIDKDLKTECYFLTFTVVDWIDIFTSSTYFDLLINCLKFHREKCKLKLYGYVIMINHMHIIAQCEDMIYFTKCFKSYTTKKIKERLENDNRLYLYKLIKNSSCNKRNKKFKIWNYKNWPVLIESERFYNQKLDYVHENPVRKGYVKYEQDWLYSSARNYILDDHSVIKVDVE